MHDFICPVCNRSMARDLNVVIPHTEVHIIEAIKKDHPEWAETGGICKKCYEYYKQQLHPKDN